MASKEATIYILDVGPTLKAKREGKNVTRFEETKQVLLKLLANKVHMARKTVYVSVILVGSDVTNNDLATVDENGADYQFVEVLQPLGVATLDMMLAVQNDVKLGETMGDCMDGLIVGLDMMTKFCKKLKYEKKIYILTDACAEIVSEGVEEVVSTMRNDNVQLNVIGTDFDGDDGEPKRKSPMQAQNEEFFRNLCTETSGDIFSLDEALDITSQFYSKKVKPTTVYRGTLDLGDPETTSEPSISIPIHMFPSTMVMKLATAKKYSVLSENVAGDELPEGGPTGAVNLSRIYKLKVTADTADGETEEDVEVPADSLEKAYMYGKTIVPMRDVDVDTFKLRTTRSMSILGFFSETTFKREWLLSNVYSVFAAPGEPKAEAEMAAILFALKETKTYALCRYVRVDDAEPKLGVLWPEILDDIKCLYFGQVAFKEDIRLFTFASLNEVRNSKGKVLDKHRLLATSEQVSAAKDFIGALDLMTADDGDEYLKPEDVYNPALQRQKQLLEFRALNPTAEEFPPIQESLISQLMPNPELMTAAQQFADSLIRLWAITKVEESTKAKRGYAATLESEQDGLSLVSGSGSASMVGVLDGQNNKRPKSESVFGTATSGSVAGGVGSALGGSGERMAASGMIPFEMSAVREVGTSDPVKDFRAMVRIATIHSQQGVRPAGAGWVTVSMAVDQMKSMVLKLISDSFGDQLYEKAMDCLKSLREFLSSSDMAGLADGGSEEKDTIKTRVETWNGFIKEVKQTCLNTSVSPVRTDFWDLVVLRKKDLGLIMASEVPEGAGGVTEAEAEQFLLEAKEDDAPMPMADTDAPDEDELFAEMD